MLAEAISIVIAPKDRAQPVGIFCLTVPVGLNTVRECRLSGFHAHPDGLQIYMHAPHIEVSDKLAVKVADIR